MDMAGRPNVFLFSTPRTLSNLLVKLLSDQPEWRYGTYYFHDALKYLKFTLGRISLEEATISQRQEYNDLLEQGFAKFQADREAAEANGQPIFVKNHAYQLVLPTRFWPGMPDQKAYSFCISPDFPVKTNPTFLPDEILTSVIPLFTIRHPALVVESWYRAESRALCVDLSDQSWKSLAGYGLILELYDWFLERCPERMAINRGHGPFYPLVIEADDILEDGQAIAKLCQLCNMDPKLVPLEWETRELPEDSWTSSYVRGLWTSTSIDKSRSGKGLDLEQKFQEWRHEFGLDTAEYLMKYTKRELESYFYLRQRRIR